MGWSKLISFIPYSSHKQYHGETYGIRLVPSGPSQDSGDEAELDEEIPLAQWKLVSKNGAAAHLGGRRHYNTCSRNAFSGATMGSKRDEEVDLTMPRFAHDYLVLELSEKCPNPSNS